MGSLLRDRFQPSLVIALAKVALIGTWKGRTFLDDDSDLSDVAEFTPVDSIAPAALSHAADAAPAVQRPVAA